MASYRVTITEVAEYAVHVEANSEDAAIWAAEEEFLNNGAHSYPVVVEDRTVEAEEIP
ncbi:DpnD/PcfM family protein [Kribbella italica]|uniref:Uncharacterized protein n=1 Tax=Kribbella italica TaxID=1540520 RepID=A0A7W9J0L0_9ACTN|nr:DpnD/PcfM family protein [Kribbella italica]MBB5833441.1 hypothetical protein [Kribbella italica]